MERTLKIEPDFDEFDEFEADSDPELEHVFEEDLNSYLANEDAKQAQITERKALEDPGVHRLPGDWQDFDYVDDDWDN